MKDKVLNKCMSFILENNKNLTSIEIDKIKYGLEGLYLTFSKLIIIFIIAYIFGILKEVVLLLLLFNIIRLTSFGVHAKRSIDCLISSTLLFLIFPFLCIKLSIPLFIKIIIFFPIVILIAIYAPADTEKRPLVRKKRRMIYKIISISISVIYMILSMIINNNTISNCLIFSLIIQIIVILPITYKIFGVKYNNYKNYEVIN